MRKIKVGIIQQANVADMRANLMNLAKSIEACAAHGAQLVVLQELHNSLYFCQTENTQLFDLAEPIPGPSTGFYSELAAANNIVLVTSLFEKRAPGLYHNTAVVFERDGSIAGKYRKMHIPDDPAYYEKFYFTPGDLGFEPIQTSLGKLGVLVCWDQWYPEAARLMALKGAELLIYPTAIGWESSDTDDEKSRQLNAWIISQRGHAVAKRMVFFFGEIVLWLVRKVSFWRRLVMISLRILWWKLIWNVRRMSVVGGHSCVTAGLTPMKD